MIIGLQRYFNIKRKVSPMLLGSLYRGGGQLELIMVYLPSCISVSHDY